MLLPLLVLTVALAPAAWAGDLVPRWDQPVRYHAEAQVQTPNGYRYLGRYNVEAVVLTHELSVDLACVPTPEAGRVDCTLERVELGGQARASDEQAHAAILTEYQQALQGQVAQVYVSADGRIGTIDLEGVGKEDDRQAQIHETLRQLLRRVLAPLDLGMPRKGDPKSGTWRQKGTPLLFQLLTDYGTAGGSVMKHTLTGREGSLALIESEGRGNLSTGLDFELNASQMVNMVGGGTGAFDTSTGQLAWRTLAVSGELTTESIQYGDPVVYGLAAWVGRIGPDGVVQTPPAR